MFSITTSRSTLSNGPASKNTFCSTLVTASVAPTPKATTRASDTRPYVRFDDSGLPIGLAFPSKDLGHLPPAPIGPEDGQVIAVVGERPPLAEGRRSAVAGPGQRDTPDQVPALPSEEPGVVQVGNPLLAGLPVGCARVSLSLEPAARYLRVRRLQAPTHRDA